MDLNYSPEEASFREEVRAWLSANLPADLKDKVASYVHLSKDGQIVVLHDKDTRRTAGVEGKVAQMTLAKLRKLDVGRWKHARFAGEKVPTLEEMLARVPAGKKVYVEVKCGPEIVPELDRVLKASKLKPQQTATVVPEGLGGSHAATVKVIDSVFDTASGTFGVRLEMPNAGGKVPAGIRCRVDFPELRQLVTPASYTRPAAR